MESRPLTFYEELIYTFQYLPLFIQIAIVLTLVAVTSTLIAYTAIIVKRWKAYVYETRKSWIMPALNDLVMSQVLLNDAAQTAPTVDDVVFDEDVLNKPEYRRKWVRQLLIEVLMDYRKNFTGETGLLFRKLYIDMDLEKLSFAKLKSVNANRKIQGLLELTKMDIPISDVTILPLTNSKKPALRVAARNAYIQLSKNEPFKFFDVASEPLLPWDQLEMFRIITTTEGIEIPNFSRWVSYSANKSIISFCLKLIAHYDQQNAIPTVMQLLNTKDHLLRADAITCLGKLRADSAEDRLVYIYSNQPLICQLQILKAIGMISSGKYLDFIKHEFLYSSNFDVKMSAARALIAHPGSDEMVAEMMQAVTPENQLILKHCSNPLIKN